MVKKKKIRRYLKPRRYKKPKRKIEWNLFAVFGILLVLWMLVGMPILNGITKTHGVIVSYGIYLLIIGVIGFFFGHSFDRGLESLLLFIATIVMIDIISPPIVIPHGGDPSLELLSIWGSDTFMYSLWTMVGLAHNEAWLGTYILTPLIGFFIMLYFLSGRALKNKLLMWINGG